jgi:hypothetical protein
MWKEIFMSQFEVLTCYWNHKETPDITGAQAEIGGLVNTSRNRPELVS